MFPRHIFLITVLLAWGAISRAEGVHLFILSGQSNMARMDAKRVFIPEIQKHFGKDNVLVCKDAWGGQPIRRWYKDWTPTGNQNTEQIGDLYLKVRRRIKGTLNSRPIKSATFIWMQGERDAKEKLSHLWESSFYGVVDQLKTDLSIEDMNIIVGRLSDCNLGQEHWDAIRAIQMKIGESGENRAWVNTDDLNDEVMVNGKLVKDDLHYSPEGYDTLAKRYVELVKKMVSLN